MPHPDGLEAALLIAMTPLLSPQGWDYVLVVCTPAVVCLANYNDRLPRALRLLSVVAVAAIGLTLFDLVGRTDLLCVDPDVGRHTGRARP